MERPEQLYEHIGGLWKDSFPEQKAYLERKL